VTMEVEGVYRVVGGLIRATETKKVGRDDTAARREKMRNHPPIKVAPGRLAVQAEKYRRRCWSLVEIGHRQTGEAHQMIDAVRAPRKAGQIGKAFLRGSQDLVHFYLDLMLSEMDSHLYACAADCAAYVAATLSTRFSRGPCRPTFQSSSRLN